MDLGIRVKSMDLVVRFLTHDLTSIGSARTAKLPLELTSGSVPLPRATPESQGVKSVALKKLVANIDAGEHLDPHALMVLRHGKVILETSWSPYRLDVPMMLYSMSKSVTATAIGIAVDEGYLSLDDKLVDIFKDCAPSIQTLFLRNVTIRHLLTMSVGVRFNEVGSALCEDWQRMYMESVPKFEPGSAFEYNSLNSYMLAAAIVRKTGMSLNEFLTPRLFEPLGIAYHEWEVCPKGVEKGGWGLNLLLEDSAKLGELYLRNGVWSANGEEKRILSEDWVKQATRQQIPTPNGEAKFGYGYQIWMNPIEQAYQFNGAFGQYVVVIPRYDMVLAIYSGSAQLFADGSLLDIIKGFLDTGVFHTALPESSRAQARLAPTLTELHTDIGELSGASTDKNDWQTIQRRLDGREYHLKNNIVSAFPLVLQGVHNNFTDGTYLVRFLMRDGALTAQLYEGADRHELPLTPGAGGVETFLTLAGERQLCNIRTEYLIDKDDQIVLRLAITFLETPNTRVIQLRVEDHAIWLSAQEYPSVSDATLMLFELAGFSQRDFMKDMMNAFGGSRMKMIAQTRDLMEPCAQGLIVK